MTEPTTAFIIELTQDECAAVLRLAQHLYSDMKEITPTIIQQVLMDAVFEDLFEIDSHAANDGDVVSSADALNQVLQPNVSQDVKLNVTKEVLEKSATPPEDMFELLATQHPDDKWIKAILDLSDTQADADAKLRWRRALAIVYGTVFGTSRAEWGTWILIERTFRLLEANQK